VAGRGNQFKNWLQPQFLPQAETQANPFTRTRVPLATLRGGSFWQQIGFENEETWEAALLFLPIYGRIIIK